MTLAVQVKRRDAPPRAVHALHQAGVEPLLARLLAARGVQHSDELRTELSDLLPPNTLHGIDIACALLAQAITQAWSICVVADYDCDGATACAVALRGLQRLGADPKNLDFLVPDRQIHGYGLTPAIVDLLPKNCQLLVTVDNGIASFEGVSYAQSLGIKVLVTDHHLPAQVNGQVQLPSADALVNPNQPGCSFASRNLAGVGVMFYVLMATRAVLRTQGHFNAAPWNGQQPRLDALLDLVALGTVADVVVLDANNRRLVAQGLKRIRAGQMQPGVRALFHAASRNPDQAGVSDFGFALGPRINAAGRLADMRLGIRCLCTDSIQEAQELAQQLDAINHERRHVEGQMREQADLQVQQCLSRLPQGQHLPSGLALFDAEFHEGVVGIVAGRLKEQLHRPIFVFAPGQDGALKGSGRSIPGFHLRDALDWMSKQDADVMLRFGGHAMAAGCTISAQAFERFSQLFDQVCKQWLSADLLQRIWLVDGPLPQIEQNAHTAHTLSQNVWGQGFEAPLFCDTVEVLEQRLLKGKHCKLRVRRVDPANGPDAEPYSAIWFGRTEPLPDRVQLIYQLALDEFRGPGHIQWMVQAAV